MSIDPSHQRFIDDAALGAKVRALMPTPTIIDEQKAAMLRTSVKELEALVEDAESRANDLANALAKMTADRDALLAWGMAKAKEENDALRASEAQAIDDADALCEWLRYYDYPSCRFTTVVGAAIKPACMRALDRRAKKEASDDTVKPAQNDTCDT